MLETPVSPARFYLRITSLEEKILKNIIENPGITTKEIQEAVKAKSYSNISKVISEMARAGYIDREVDGIYSRWSINPQSNAADIIQLSQKA